MNRIGQNRVDLQAAELFHELESKGEAPKGREQAPILHTSSYQLKQLQQKYLNLYQNDSEFRRFIRLLVATKAFRYFITSIVFVNTIVVALDNHSKEFEYLELIFFCLYFVEFVMKYYVERDLYWKSSYNKLDFGLLFISIFQLIFQALFPYLNVTYLKVVRGLRALRALRSISLFRSLQVIVNALANTIKTSVIDIIILLLLVMYLFAVIGYHMFGSDPNNPTAFSNLGTAFYVLFVWVTADGWTDRQSELDQKGYDFNRWFAIVFVFIGNFVFTNLFIAVICKNIDEATDSERKLQKQRKLMAKKYKKDVFSRKQKDELIQLMAQQKQMQNSNIQQVFQALAGQLHHEDIVPMSHLSCNLKWIETYALTLKYHEQALKRVQLHHFELANVLAELMDRKIQRKEIQ